MTTRRFIGDRLHPARRENFVDRDDEVGRFRAAVAAESWPRSVYYLHGPGGVGKTTLLHEYRYSALERDIPVTWIDCRRVEASPVALVDAILASVRITGDLGEGQTLDDLFAEQTRRVLVLDTWERLATLEEWFRDEFLPLLPVGYLVVLGSRREPPREWRSDPGWRELTEIVSLRFLAEEECRKYLTMRAVPEAHHDAIVGFTHGHPLALSLAADTCLQDPGGAFEPADSPDLIRAILDLFVEDVPSPHHRLALEISALVRVTTEDLLAEMLPDDADAPSLFEWLRQLSMMEAGPRGIFPHDLARQTLTAELRWRNPQRFTELFGKARAFHFERVQEGRGGDPHRLSHDLIFLYRANPVVRPLFDWQFVGGGWMEPATAADRDAIVRMTREQMSADAAARVGAWFDARPECLHVCRQLPGQVDGYLLALPMDDYVATDEDDEVDDLPVDDPLVASARDWLRDQARVRPGERCVLYPYWLAAQTGQALSPVQSLVFARVVRDYLTLPSLAWTLFAVLDADAWHDWFATVDLQRVDAGDSVTWYGHDWRATPPASWLDRLDANVLDGEAGASSPAVPPAPAPTALVLSRPDFDKAVRDALRHLNQPDKLEKNPLARSRLVLQAADNADDPADCAETLAGLLHDAADRLRSTPQLDKFYRALHRTFINPAETQEAAADMLGVPFSTFRRHLRRAEDHVAEALWEQELDA